MVSAVMLTAFTAYVHAQDPIRIELADISIGTGLEDGRLCALMSESFLESDEGLSLVERMNSCLTDNSYREMASQMKNNLESLAESRKQYEGKTDETSREILSALDENIARCKELIGQYSSNSDGAADATALLEEIRSHSLGGRLYHFPGTLQTGKLPYNTFYRDFQKRSVRALGQNSTFPGHYRRANCPTIRSNAVSRNVVSALWAKTALSRDTTDGQTALEYVLSRFPQT